MSNYWQNEGRSGEGLRSRFVLFSKGKDKAILGATGAHRTENGKTVIPMYSEFFSRANGNMMMTANMYETLRTEIQSVVSAYPVKEKIILNVYANSASANELDMEGLVVGFRRFIFANHVRSERTLKVHFISTFVLFLIGMAMRYAMISVGWFASHELAQYFVDILAELLVWQFAAFAAIDLVGEVRKIRRLSQIEKVEFTFKHWE